MLKEWVPENGNLVSEGSIPPIGGIAWKLLTAADEGRGLVLYDFGEAPRYVE
jgi:PDZ domain-containing secreted protein